MATGLAVLQRESLTDALWDELMPLLAAHWDEIAHHRDIPLKPDKTRYFQLQTNGHLRVWTSRLEGAIIGYLAVFVAPNLHYADCLTASQDVLYVDPAHRHGRLGSDMIQHAEHCLRAEGCQVFVQHSKASADKTIGRFLQRHGYELMDLVYTKRLDR